MTRTNTSVLLAFLVLAPALAAQALPAHEHPSVSREDRTPNADVVRSESGNTAGPFVARATTLYANLFSYASGGGHSWINAAGFAAQTTILKGSQTVSWEGVLWGSMHVEARVDLGPAILSTTHATVAGGMASSSGTLANFNKTSCNGVSIGNATSGSITLNIGAQLAIGPAGVGVSTTITVNPSTNSKVSAIVAVTGADTQDDKTCDVTLASNGSIALDTNSFGLLRIPEAWGSIPMNSWKGTVVHAFCPVDAAFIDTFTF